MAIVCFEVRLMRYASKFLRARDATTKKMLARSGSCHCDSPSLPVREGKSRKPPALAIVEANRLCLFARAWRSPCMRQCNGERLLSVETRRWGNVFYWLLEHPCGCCANQGQNRSPTKDVNIRQQCGLLLHQAVK